MKYVFSKDSRGLSILITVIVISAMALILATTATLISIDTLQSSMRQTDSFNTFTSTDGCVEEVLMRLHASGQYTDDTFTIGNVVCVVSISIVGSRSTITLHATDSNSYTRAVEVIVDKTDKYYITSWKELDS